jgi:hypothetical protein
MAVSRTYSIFRKYRIFAASTDNAMKKDFKDRLSACVKDLTGAEIKGIVVDEEGGQVSVVLVPGRGHGRVSLSQLPDVLKVADVDIVGGDITLLGAYAGVRDFVDSWNLEADDPRIGRFIEILRRETRGEVANVEFRSGELLYELTVRTLDFTAPEYVYIEGVDFRSRVLYCYTFVEDMNDILETDSFSILGYPFSGSIKS